MKIEILKSLENYPGKGLRKNESLSLDGITKLEQQYNQGNPFPKALKELLFLAGKYCNVLDYGWNDTQQEVQEEAKELLTRYNRSITRPFFVIDVYTGDTFLFVYLDEGVDDPIVYDAFPAPLVERPWLTSSEKKLSEVIERRLEKLKKGFNPF